jgi:hypothetical protein
MGKYNTNYCHMKSETEYPGPVTPTTRVVRALRVNGG